MFQIIVDQLGLRSVFKEWTEDGRSCVGHVSTDTDNIGYSVYDIDMADTQAIQVRCDRPAFIGFTMVLMTYLQFNCTFTTRYKISIVHMIFFLVLTDV